MRPGLLEIVLALRQRSDSVVVALSRGKDSLALLHLCKQHFARVEAFYMHLVPGISFAEKHLAYLERRYGISVHRLPHWWLSHAFRQGSYRPISRDCPRVTIRDVQARARELTGLEWVVSGERAHDSLQRRGMLSANGGIDEKAKVAYPLSWWTNRQLYHYLKAHLIPLPPDYRVFGRSFSCFLDGRTMSLLQEHYPDDYARVEETFPQIGAAVAQYRAEQQRQREQREGEGPAAQAAGVHGRARRAQPDQPGALQPQAPGRPLGEEAG